MRRAGSKPAEEAAVEMKRVDKPHAYDVSKRLAALRVVVVAALLYGILLSLNLWFPSSRSLPRAPVINALSRTVIPTFEYLLSGLLVVTLVALMFGRWTKRLLTLVVILLALEILSDQMRLQPWVYQYLLILIALALSYKSRRDETVVALLQLIVASLYFWSGVQKLNYAFSHEVLSQVLSPLQAYLSLTQTQLTTLGVGIALAEILTGCGLLLRRTRNLCLGLALVMHVIVLELLISQDQNSVVWGWNAALPVFVLILFRHSDASLRSLFADSEGGNFCFRAAQVLAFTCAVLPVSSLWGWWDMYLSGALYSGNTIVAVVRVDERIYEKLPETSKRHVFKTRSGETMLPLFEWSMAELNVPPYPEPRVFKQVARELCESAEEKGQVEMIMRGRPAMLSGEYEIIRIGCTNL